MIFLSNFIILNFWIHLILIYNIVRSRGDIRLLKEELARRVQESDLQRQEMAVMAGRWEQEVRSIQETHVKEKMELDEVGTW